MHTVPGVQTRCPSGHEMIKGKTTEQLSCDGCSISIPKGELTFSCAECDHDCCHECSSIDQSLPGMSDFLKALSPGDILEVEVEEEGDVVWKPARVHHMQDNGHFVVCVNGESDFLEEFGMEDEGSEWRHPARPEDVRIAFEAAAAVASGSPPLGQWKVEAILCKQQVCNCILLLVRQLLSA